MDATEQSLSQAFLEKPEINSVAENQLQTSALCSENREAFRQAVSSALERCFFYKRSFNIYGGVAGFFDYGPPGFAVESNVLSLWRQHFVLEEQMMEIRCPSVTP
ncbi:hypothetical protein AALP_AA1G292800 [Arabis alpina]|uniref:Glycine--tRNA ligase n=1 Tax=Arabis alpina TaxID=50452 RepID=A0A087HRF7_ARAAL|nr:hypothetical protein AALP_AA1G292800 [Arabis alpina]